MSGFRLGILHLSPGGELGQRQVPGLLPEVEHQVSGILGGDLLLRLIQHLLEHGISTAAAPEDPAGNFPAALAVGFFRKNFCVRIPSTVH